MLARRRLRQSLAARRRQNCFVGSKKQACGKSTSKVGAPVSLLSYPQSGSDPAFLNSNGQSCGLFAIDLQCDFRFRLR
jgi:hypothetical protein